MERSCWGGWGRLVEIYGDRVQPSGFQLKGGCSGGGGENGPGQGCDAVAFEGNAFHHLREEHIVGGVHGLDSDIYRLLVAGKEDETCDADGASGSS